MAFTTPADRPSRSTWKPGEIAIIVVGFMIYWPVGLAVLLYKIWKDRGSEGMSFDFSEIKRAFSGFQPVNTGGNTAFDAYKRETLERLERERQKLQDEERAFGDFLRDLRRAKDQEEFDRFMASRNASA